MGRVGSSVINFYVQQKAYLCKGYAFLYIQTSHILFTDESMQKKGAIKNTAHQIIIYGGNIYE